MTFLLVDVYLKNVYQNDLHSSKTLDENDRLYIQSHFALKFIRNNRDAIYTAPYGRESQKSLREPHEVPYLA